MNVLDELNSTSVDVRTLITETDCEHRFRMFPNKTLRECLIDGLPGRRIILLVDFRLHTDNEIGQELFIQEYMNTSMKFYNNIKEFPNVNNLSDAVFIRNYFGSKNYCSMSNENDYDSLFDEPPVMSDDAYRCFTFGLSFCVECRSLYAVIKMLYSLRSTLFNKHDAKLVIEQHKRFKYCIDLNAWFLRDIELWNSANRSQKIEDFPYTHLFSYMTGRPFFELSDLQKAIDRHVQWLERCQWEDIEKFTYKKESADY